MHIEWQALQILHKCYHLPQLLCHHVGINLIARDFSWPAPVFLDQKMPKRSFCMKCSHPLCEAEPTILCHHLPWAMDGLSHVQQELYCLQVPLLLPLWWVSPLTIKYKLGPVLPLHQTNVPDDWTASVAIGNQVILISEGLGLRGRDIKLGQNLLSHVFIDSLIQLSHNGTYSKP